MSGINKAFSDVQASSASAGIPPQKQAGRAREVVGDFSEFLKKRNHNVELHWEIYGDRKTFERILSVTALASDGHLLKFERRAAPTPDADDELTKELGHLEVKHSVKATLGRWC